MAGVLIQACFGGVLAWGRRRKRSEWRRAPGCVESMVCESIIVAWRLLMSKKSSLGAAERTALVLQLLAKEEPADPSSSPSRHRLGS
jgi:hypothetical protein